ncbi:hypothetical protein HDU76_009359, partial [Blyttiomyces sp. JEL0837]
MSPPKNNATNIKTNSIHPRSTTATTDVTRIQQLEAEVAILREENSKLLKHKDVSSKLVHAMKESTLKLETENRQMAQREAENQALISKYESDIESLTSQLQYMWEKQNNANLNNNNHNITNHQIPTKYHSAESEASLTLTDSAMTMTDTNQSSNNTPPPPTRTLTSSTLSPIQSPPGIAVPLNLEESTSAALRIHQTTIANLTTKVQSLESLLSTSATECNSLRSELSSRDSLLLQSAEMIRDRETKLHAACVEIENMSRNMILVGERLRVLEGEKGNWEARMKELEVEREDVERERV